MSLIHEQVYRSEMLADLDFGQCVELLADRLFGTYCVDPSRIRLEVKVEAIRMPADDAIPCGLILNELLANSLKHAFGDDREGVIRVLLKKTEDGSAELTVADNGVGLPDNFQWNEAQSLGLRLVRILIHQLRADLFVSGHDGATFRFAWKLPAPLPVAMQCV
jgi:two-component sensor histidine kinase